MRIFIILLLVIGCASQSVEDEQGQLKTKDQREDLGLSKEVEEKFKITKKSPVTEKPVSKTVATKEKTKTKTKAKSEVQAKQPVKKVGFEFPADYPEEYKKYDEKYQSVWEKFDPSYIKASERIKMRVSYLGLGMGSMVMESGERVFVGDKEAYTFKARLKTADFYSYIYELDDKLEAQVWANGFVPLRYSLIQRESKKEIDDIQLFDREKYLLYYRYRKWRKDKETLTKKSEDIAIPKYALDPFSLLYFVRGLPLSMGVKYEFPVVTRDKLWIFKLQVVEKEEIETINGKKMAYRIAAEIGEEGSFIKKGELNLWFGVEKGHILWQMKVGTKIGSLYTRVSEYSSE